jgi:DNA-binding response OmpR family regulator
VLIIDDESLVRTALVRTLKAENIEAAESASGSAGIERFLLDPKGFSLVILDLAMPGMNGAECFRRLREIDPEVPILILSGYPKDQSVEALLANAHADFMAKPFDREELLRGVRALSRRVSIAA